MLDNIVQAVKEFATADETKRAFEDSVLKPCAKYADEKLSVAIRIFQVVAVLTFVQAIIVLFLLVRELRR